MLRSARLWVLCLVVAHVALNVDARAQSITSAAEEAIQSAEQNTRGSNENYVNEIFGWSLVIPPDWSPTYGAWDPVFVGFENPDRNAMFSVCVVEHNDFRGKSLDESADTWLNEWVSRLTKPYKLISRAKVTLPEGEDAVELVLEVGERGVGKSRILVVAAPGYAYLLIGETQLDAWEETRPDFDRFVDSFRMPAVESRARPANESIMFEGLMYSDYLYGGELAKSAEALQLDIAANPENDELRFCLGIVQFGLAIEHVIQDLNRHGFLTERTFGEVMPPGLRPLFPDHANPEPFSNEVLRNMVQTWIADITTAEATLAEIKQTSVKLHVRPSLIKIDPVGQGNAVDAAQLLEFMFSQEQNEQVKNFGLTLDRGDVHWLRGYLHIQAALGEALLAHDLQPMVETCAHRAFEKVETPYPWLLQERRQFLSIDEVVNPNGDSGSRYQVGDVYYVNMRYEYFEPPSVSVFLDAAAFFGQWLEVAIIEPQRFEAVLNHLEQTVENAQEMWKHILAETDDDHEWIPNPRQLGSINVEVTQPMVDAWLATLLEAQRILKGEKLIPFWRDVLQEDPQKPIRGLNLRKVLQQPPDRTAIILWVQGTAAAGYLEQGPLTEFADEAFLNRLDQAFGPSLPGFAAWFN